MNSFKCLVCEGKAAPWGSKKTGAVTYEIARCANSACGFSYSTFRPTREDIDRIYGHSGHADTAPKSLSAIMQAETVYPNSTIDAIRMVSRVRALLGDATSPSLLDVGAGYGFFSKSALQAGFRVTALEFAANESRIFTELTGLTPVETTFETYNGENGAFSAVLMSQVLEHASDFQMWIAKSQSLLKTGGVLAVAVPNFNSAIRYVMGINEPHICPPEHVNYFTMKAICLLMKKHGFVIEGAETVSRLNPVAVSRKLHAGNMGAKLLGPVCSILTGIMDGFKFGMYLNIYARKG